MLKEIKGFPGYLVDKTGNVYSKNYNHTGKIKKLKPTMQNTGYVRVALCKDDSIKYKLIHRLVAESFIPNPENKSEINHKNGIKTDNRVENLEWATRSENQKHAYQILKAYHAPAPLLNKFGKDNPKSKIVLQISNGKIIASFYGGTEAQRKTGISQSNISECCNGKRLYAGGYQWKYKEN